MASLWRYARNSSGPLGRLNERDSEYVDVDAAKLPWTSHSQSIQSEYRVSQRISTREADDDRLWLWRIRYTVLMLFLSFPPTHCITFRPGWRGEHSSAAKPLKYPACPVSIIIAWKARLIGLHVPAISGCSSVYDIDGTTIWLLHKSSTKQLPPLGPATL